MNKSGILALVFLGSICGLHAQVHPTSQSAPKAGDQPTRDDFWTANLGNDPVGPGDLLYITISGSPELTRSYRVSPEGAILLPMGHNQIPVAGLTADKISAVVAEDLKAEHLLVSPIVSAAVLDYRSRQVTVVGAVKAPGVFQVVGQLTVVDALAKAQGVAPEAGPEVIVTRPAIGGVPEKVLRIPLKPLMSGLIPEQNLPLQGGDEVKVPDAPKVYLVGNLKMPGIYPLNEVGGTTVMKALAMSQGQLTFSTRDAYIYRDVAGVHSEIPVPLRKILRRTAPDVALQPNDILYVPESSGLHLTASVLDRLASFGGSVGSGLIIWH